MERIIQGSKKTKPKKLITGLVFGKAYIILLLYYYYYYIIISLLMRRTDEIINCEYVKMNSVEDTINRITIKFSEVNAWIEIHLERKKR